MTNLINRQVRRERKQVKENVITNVGRVCDALSDIIKSFKRGYIFMNRPKEIVEESEKDKKTKTTIKELQKDVNDLPKQIKVYNGGIYTKKR